ncbi:MAG: DUF3575 domain-containing protein [Rikenellaceae bacterium]|nr:DUF3575 domain-containing protein [Rikenellaceae bacterium]
MLGEVKKIVLSGLLLTVTLPFMNEAGAQYRRARTEIIEDVTLRDSASVNSYYREGTAFIQFPVGRSRIEPGFGMNRTELAKIRENLDLIRSEDNVEITRVVITGFGSPEGKYSLNEKLSVERAQSMIDYMRYAYSDYFTYNTEFEISSVPEDWSGLATLVEEDPFLRDEEKYRIFDIIDFVYEPDARDAELAKINGGRTYRYMLNNLYPQLRRVYWRIDFRVDETVFHRVADTVSTKITIPGDTIDYANYYVRNKYGRDDDKTPQGGNVWNIYNIGKDDQSADDKNAGEDYYGPEPWNSEYYKNQDVGGVQNGDDAKVDADGNAAGNDKDKKKNKKDKNKDKKKDKKKSKNKQYTENITQNTDKTLNDANKQPVYVQQPQYEYKKRTFSTETPNVSFKTNLLYWCALTPNLAFEVYMGRKHSIGIEGGYSDWKLINNKKDWRYGVNMAAGEYRYWFDSSSGGHFLGLNGGWGKYNFRFNDRGVPGTGDQGVVYGGGLLYGYSIEVSRHFNVEFAIAVGYLRVENDEYINYSNLKDPTFIYSRTRVTNYVGPTKGSISLVFKF